MVIEKHKISPRVMLTWESNQWFDQKTTWLSSKLWW